MTPLWESRPGGQREDLDHPYKTWDAAYVLGALSAADRREFETHLGACPSCRGAVAELGGMPALLAQLDHAVVASFDTVDDIAPPPPGLLPTLLATVRRRQRRRTWVATAAAAAVLAVGAFVGVAAQPGSPAPQTQAQALPMTQVHTALLASTVSLSDQDWGTLIELRCVCLADRSAPHDMLAMVVVGRDGSRTRLASWVAQPGRTATPAASTSMPTDRIASVQVVSADSGEVLLQREL